LRELQSASPPGLRLRLVAPVDWRWNRQLCCTVTMRCPRGSPAAVVASCPVVVWGPRAGQWPAAYSTRPTPDWLVLSSRSRPLRSSGWPALITCG